MNVMSSAGILDPSEPATWPGSVTDLIAEIDRRVATCTYAQSLDFAPGDEAAVWDAIDGVAVAARHFTRLLPHEEESIRALGLRMHSRELFDWRIDEAVARGFMNQSDGDTLKAVTIPAAGSQQGKRDFVCVTVGPTWEEEPDGVELLIGHWGGEGIYFAHGAVDYQPLLRTLSRPAAVHLAVHPSRTLSFPPLPKILLGRYRNLKGAFGDVLLSDPVPPEGIVGIEYLD